MLVAFSLTLAACGQTGSGTDQESGDSPEPTSEETSESTNSMGGMDMDSEEMARQMLEDGGEYSDENFIDMMVPHHRGAIDEAEVAIENAEHEELRSLSKSIIADQRAEIEDMREIKDTEYGTREAPMQMSEEQMGMMEEPEELANEDPFDRAFIDNMIPHHQSAIAMAEVALEESENPEIRELSRNIVDSQRVEIEQMQIWREEWYPES